MSQDASGKNNPDFYHHLIHTGLTARFILDQGFRKGTCFPVGLGECGSCSQTQHTQMQVILAVSQICLLYAILNQASSAGIGSHINTNLIGRADDRLFTLKPNLPSIMTTSNYSRMTMRITLKLMKLGFRLIFTNEFISALDQRFHLKILGKRGLRNQGAHCKNVCVLTSQFTLYSAFWFYLLKTRGKNANGWITFHFYFQAVTP